MARSSPRAPRGQHKEAQQKSGSHHSIAGAAVMLARVQVIRVDGVQSTRAGVLKALFKARWFQAELLTKPSLIFGLPEVGLIQVLCMCRGFWGSGTSCLRT